MIIKHASYLPPKDAGYSTEMKEKSVKRYHYLDREVWKKLVLKIYVFSPNTFSEVKILKISGVLRNRRKIKPSHKAILQESAVILVDDQQVIVYLILKLSLKSKTLKNNSKNQERER